MHYAINGLSVSELLALDNEFNNVMHKFIFDYGLDGSASTSVRKNENYKNETIDNIDFIDISDYSTISKVKSAFLSASLLPNVVQCSRFMDSKDRSGGSQSQLNTEEIHYVLNKYIEKGSIEKDESIDFQYLKRKTLTRLQFPAHCDENNCRIHPLTYIVFNDAKESKPSFIIDTNQFLSDPLHFLN